MGNEENKIVKTIKYLKEIYPDIEFIGPIPGDSLHIYRKSNDTLFVYSFHDQGLAKFKSENGFMGVKITFGLPFLRVSVDHGTSFNLYGKNTANYIGCLYLLKYLEKIVKRGDCEK